MQTLSNDKLGKPTILYAHVSLVPVRFLGGFKVIYGKQGFSLLNSLNCHKPFFCSITRVLLYSYYMYRDAHSQAWSTCK